MEELFLITSSRYKASKYLAVLVIEKVPEVSTFTDCVTWHSRQDKAIHFTSQEEAQATIDFLINVIDEQYDGCLEVVRAQG